MPSKLFESVSLLVKSGSTGAGFSAKAFSTNSKFLQTVVLTSKYSLTLSNLACASSNILCSSVLSSTKLYFSFALSSSSFARDNSSAITSLCSFNVVIVCLSASVKSTFNMECLNTSLPFSHVC